MWGIRRTGIAALATAGLLTLPASAGAATIRPTITTDEYNQNGSGSGCSLREAVDAASKGTPFGGCPSGSIEADQILLRPGAVYRLTLPGIDNGNIGGDLDIRNDDLAIRPDGDASARITGASRLLDIAPIGVRVRVQLSDLILADGITSSEGGGIRSVRGTLSVADTAITGNRAGTDGGGIFSSADSALFLANVTISGNSAMDSGGGVYDASFDGRIVNTTFSANVADSDASGAGLGGGIYDFGRVSVRNTIVAGNSDRGSLDGTAPDCYGSLQSAGRNLIGSKALCNVAASGNRINVGALLAPLADNGGATVTHALLPGSPALRGATACPPDDQRGAPRPLAGSCDMGAYQRVRCRGAVVNLVGTDARDRLVGTSRRDGILGQGGGDVLLGKGGRDGICGGDGKDRLIGGRGNDRLQGDDGRDRLLGGRGRDRLLGNTGRDRCRGGPGRDRQRSC